MPAGPLCLAFDIQDLSPHHSQATRQYLADPGLVVALPITLILFEFMILDHYLSNQFLRWPILSPNYFYVVDRTIWRLNWSPPGKFVNSGAVTILLLATGSIWAALPVLAGLYAVNLYSFARLQRLAVFGTSGPGCGSVRLVS